MDLDGMRYFAAIAQTGSLTAAAKRLGTTKSTVSRRLIAYEQHIGCSLFRRSTRAVSLTATGKLHFERIKDLILEAESAYLEIASTNQSPVGLLRISASVNAGQRLLAPFIWHFMEKYPGVKIELLLTDELVDVIADGVDFTLRMGELQDSELLVRRLGKGYRGIVASPKFLQQYQMPESISALKQLPAIVTTSDKNIWRFASGSSVSVNWKVAAGSIPLAVEAALHGVGMAMVPLGFCRTLLQESKLVQLLPDEPLPDIDISLVYPRLQYQSGAAQAFLKEIRAATQFNWPQ